MEVIALSAGGILLASFIVWLVTLAVRHPKSYDKAFNLMAACGFLAATAYGFYALGADRGAKYAAEQISKGLNPKDAVPTFSMLPLVVGAFIFMLAAMLPPMINYLDLKNTDKD